MIGIGLVAFVSTNIDDLVLLVAFFADHSYRTLDIVVGQIAGIALLIGVSVACSLLALLVPDAYIGLGGLIPIAIGVRTLWARTDSGDGDKPPGRRAATLATVMVATIANGGDNLSLYIPLFAVHDTAEIAVLAGVFLAMTVLWCAAAFTLARSRLFGITANRSGRVAALVMIGLGLYILMTTKALSLIGL